jgi:ubiquinone biosynthesis protein Coq4|tara:strand:+ start:103 stop:768 length:666 start_codon:yes stop_codon:yes gene_type:complete
MFRSISLLYELFKYNPKDKDNANLIAKVVVHFNGLSLEKQMYTWAKTPTGRRYLAGERINDNIEEFRKRDVNTLGRKYLEFMDRFYFDKLADMIDLKNHGITGSNIEQKYGLFIMDVHDFLHVITKYPPDPFGELMRIKVFKKYEGRGWAVVDFVGRLWAISRGPKEAWRYHQLAREARQMRKFSKNYMFEDWFEMLGWHVNKVRKNLSTKSTTLYDYENT